MHQFVDRRRVREYWFEVTVLRSAQLSFDSFEFLIQCELPDIVGVDVSWVAADHQYARPRHINVSNPHAKVGPCALRASTVDLKTHGLDVVAVGFWWTITMDQDDVSTAFVRLKDGGQKSRDDMVI